MPENTLDKITRINIGNETYYSVKEYRKFVDLIEKNMISLDEDMLITPFYISEIGTYELLRFELSVHTVTNPEITQTPKSLFEIFKNQNQDFVKALISYFELLIESSEILGELPEKLAETYSANNLYFAMY